MKIVVDTNILITYFWKENVFEKLTKNYSIDCFSPEYALVELNKYKDLIMEKANIGEEEFEKKKLNLALSIDFISEEYYKKSLKKALKITSDPNDIDFIALALFLKTSLWSNDKGLKKQKTIPVFSTEDLLENPHLFL